jgi:RNA polymerase sigma-70 factor (ECF subfamily)
LVRQTQAGKTERELAGVIDAARRGSEQAWATLYKALAGPVLGYLRSQGASEPEDLLGEVFLQLARNIGTFDGHARGFRSWVFMVAHNRLIDERRRRSRRPVYAVSDTELEDVRSPADVEALATDFVTTDAIRGLFSLLTAEQRAVLDLRILGGLTIEEVSVVLGKPAGAVKALQRRGLAAIRAQAVLASVS